MWIPYFSNNDSWQEFRQELLSWEGTPYRHLWMAKGRGADCTLYIAACLKAVGVFTDVTYDYYPRDWHIHAPTEFVLSGLYRHFMNHAASDIDAIKIDSKSSADWLPGDIIGFSLTTTGVTNHAAVWFGDFPETKEKKQMYNSVNEKGVTRFTYGTWWKKRLTIIFRIMREI